jgi:hypothetical protein
MVIMFWKKPTIVILAIVIGVALLAYSPDYLPVPRILARESSQTVVEAAPVQVISEAGQWLQSQGFAPTVGEQTMRERPDFYSCSGPRPTDDAVLRGIYRNNETSEPVFAELRVATVEPEHSFVSIDYFMRYGNDRYANRRHLRTAQNCLSRYREKTDEWFADQRGAPRAVAMSLQYAPERPVGTSYIVVDGDSMRLAEQPLPAWLSSAIYAKSSVSE